MRIHRRRLHWSCLGLWFAFMSSALVFTPAVEAQEAPTLQIVEPADGGTVDGPFIFRIKSSGFGFAGLRINEQPRPGVGLWTVTIDGQYAGLATAPVLELPNDAFPVITVGGHTLTAELRGLDFAPLNPPVTHSIKVNATKDIRLTTNTSAAPLRLVAPSANTTINSPFLCRVEYSGVKFDGLKIGKDPEPGVGHWHVNIDGIYAGLSVSNLISLPNGVFQKLTPGKHVITIDLHQNNHAVFDPPVFQSVEINVDKELSIPQAPGVPIAQPIPADRFGPFPALPNTGQSDMNWPLTVSIGLVCFLVGVLLVAVVGTPARDSAGRSGDFTR
jgi:hypothetical protein